MAANLCKVTRLAHGLFPSGCCRVPGFWGSGHGPHVLLQQPCRGLPTSKHYDPRFRRLRKAKVFKMDLPDFQKMIKESRLPPDEVRIKFKKEGKLPPRTFQERPLNISSTGSVFEPFIPPEGDGKSSSLSLKGAKDRSTELQKKGKSFLELRKVRQFEKEFDTKEFAVFAQETIVEAQTLLQDVVKNEERLLELVTEKAFPEMVFGLNNKTFQWQFVESIEPPRVVHVRTTEMMAKENLYAQVTVRLHTKQILAVYDRFGRLMYGDPVIPKDVLEYVVLEKHIANEYGLWRIHGKVVPDWMPEREPLRRTYRHQEFEPLPELEEEEEGEGGSKVAEKSDSPSDGPQVATA